MPKRLLFMFFLSKIKLETAVYRLFLNTIIFNFKLHLKPKLNLLINLGEVPQLCSMTENKVATFYLK